MTGEETATFEVQLPPRWKARLSGEAGGEIVAAAPTASSASRILVSGSVTMHDYENFGPDEHGTFGFSQETMLSVAGPGQTLLVWEQRFGGEERTEIEIVGALNAGTGACQATINVRFYEGSSESTTELEDSRSFVSIVPEGRVANFDLRLANDENDWTRVLGSISNTSL